MLIEQNLGPHMLQKCAVCRRATQHLSARQRAPGIERGYRQQPSPATRLSRLWDPVVVTCLCRLLRQRLVVVAQSRDGVEAKVELVVPPAESEPARMRSFPSRATGCPV
jgi:hypothetical protein